MVIYFDTSAVNYAMQRLSVADALATYGFQRVRGRRWSLSPIAIWEILNTSDELARERLIHFSQHLFSEILLPSPEELLISYIRAGCPLQEDRRELVSEAPLATTWREICMDRRRTLGFDHHELRRRMRLIAPITRDLHRITRDRSISLDRYGAHVGMDLSLDSVVQNLSWVRGGEELSPLDRKLYKISSFYMALILCAEVGVNPEPVQQFWREIGIDDTWQRFFYALDHFEVLIHRGPLLIMAYMTVVQAQKKFSRGLFWDGLHAFYLTYVDLMLSEDPAFQELRDALPRSPLPLRIHRASDLEWTFHPRENPVQPAWWT